jgi:hypothetical protein
MITVCLLLNIFTVIFELKIQNGYFYLVPNTFGKYLSFMIVRYGYIIIYSLINFYSPNMVKHQPIELFLIGSKSSNWPLIKRRTIICGLFWVIYGS